MLCLHATGVTTSEKLMKKISVYSKLIKELPVDEQSTTIKKEVWERINYKGKKEIENLIFLNSSEIEISRKQVKKENNLKKKIVMILMWGYPTGGRGNNIQNVLSKLNELVKIFSVYKDIDLTLDEFTNLIEMFNKITGLGISTWTKFLYFFDISINSRKCEIFDLKIVESLNKKQFIDLKDKIWIQNFDHYIEYINLLYDISCKLKVRADQVEIFLFYFNLYYKFDI